MSRTFLSLCTGLVVSPDVPITVGRMSFLLANLNTDASNAAVTSAVLHLPAAKSPFAFHVLIICTSCDSQPWSASAVVWSDDDRRNIIIYRRYSRGKLWKNHVFVEKNRGRCCCRLLGRWQALKLVMKQKKRTLMLMTSSRHSKCPPVYSQCCALHCIGFLRQAAISEKAVSTSSGAMACHGHVT